MKRISQNKHRIEKSRKRLFFIYIYTCNATEGNILENKTGIKAAVAVKGLQKVMECETVGDVYQKILEHEKAGQIIIRRYEELTEEEHSINKKMILAGIRRENLLQGSHPLSSFVAHKFPDVWDQAKCETKKEYCLPE